MTGSRKVRTRKLKVDRKFNPPPRDDGDKFFPNGIFEFNVTKLLAFINANVEKFPVEMVEVEPLVNLVPEKSALNGST